MIRFVTVKYLWASLKGHRNNSHDRLWDPKKTTNLHTDCVVAFALAQHVHENLVLQPTDVIETHCLSLTLSCESKATYTSKFMYIMSACMEVYMYEQVYV